MTMAEKKKDNDFSLDNAIPLPEAAALADVSDRWMRHLVQTGLVPGRRIGRNWLVDGVAAAQFKRHPSMGRPRDSEPKRRKTK
jgi:hypothetical protein